MNVFRHAEEWWISAVALGLRAVLAFAAAAVLYEWDPKNQRPQCRKLIAVAALLPYISVAALPLVENQKGPGESPAIEPGFLAGLDNVHSDHVSAGLCISPEHGRHRRRSRPSEEPPAT